MGPGLAMIANWFVAASTARQGPVNEGSIRNADISQEIRAAIFWNIAGTQMNLPGRQGTHKTFGMGELRFCAVGVLRYIHWPVSMRKLGLRSETWQAPFVGVVFVL